LQETRDSISEEVFESGQDRAAAYNQPFMSASHTDD